MNNKLNPHELFKEGKLADVLAKLPESIDLDLQGEDNYSVIVPVMQSGDESLAIALVEAGIDLGKYENNQKGNDILNWACICEMYFLIRLLIKKGLDPHLFHRCGFNTLGLVIRNENAPVELVQELLEQGVSVEGLEYARGMSMLDYCIENDRVDLAKLLLEYGADPNYVNLGYGGVPLLTSALYEDKPHFVPLLLSYGARRDLKNARGQTAYDIAIIRGHHEVAERLKP